MDFIASHTYVGWQKCQMDALRRALEESKISDAPLSPKTPLSARQKAIAALAAYDVEKGLTYTLQVPKWNKHLKIVDAFVPFLEHVRYEQKRLAAHPKLTRDLYIACRALHHHPDVDVFLTADQASYNLFKLAGYDRPGFTIEAGLQLSSAFTVRSLEKGGAAYVAYVDTALSMAKENASPSELFALARRIMRTPLIDDPEQSAPSAMLLAARNMDGQDIADPNKIKSVVAIGINYPQLSGNAAETLVHQASRFMPVKDVLAQLADPATKNSPRLHRNFISQQVLPRVA